MTRAQSLRGGAALVAAFAWLGTATAQSAARSANIRVLSSNGVRAVLDELVPQCERSLGRRVTIEYGTSASIRQRVAAGEPADVVFATTEVAGELANGGYLARDSQTPLGRSGIGIGIRAGVRHPGIATPTALKQTLLAAKSVTYAQDGASRVHIERMFEHLGVTVDCVAAPAAAATFAAKGVER